MSRKPHWGSKEDYQRAARNRVRKLDTDLRKIRAITLAEEAQKAAAALGSPEKWLN